MERNERTREEGCGKSKSAFVVKRKKEKKRKTSAPDDSNLLGCPRYLIRL